MPESGARFLILGCGPPVWARREGGGRNLGTIRIILTMILAHGASVVGKNRARVGAVHVQGAIYMCWSLVITPE
jgi:hypothetical protein